MEKDLKIKVWLKSLTHHFKTAWMTSLRVFLRMQQILLNNRKMKTIFSWIIWCKFSKKWIQIWHLLLIFPRKWHPFFRMNLWNIMMKKVRWKRSWCSLMVWCIEATWWWKLEIKSKIKTLHPLIWKEGKVIFDISIYKFC